MSSSTFYRKYRPQKFSEVIGQKHVVTTLTNALKLGKVGQAYLFTGPRGTGKTTLARLFAKAINCSNRKGAEPCGKCEHCLLMAEGRSFDIIEIDAASHTGVDNIRELRETVTLPPTVGSHKVYIIDEVHMLSIGAFNALLKTLEEPPAHVIFLLATTALHKVPDTIVSRCQRFDLSRFPLQSIVDKLSHIAKEEKIKITDDALQMVAFAAEGGMRDAESLLMQIASLGASPITEETVTETLGTTSKEHVITLIQLLGNNDLYKSLALIREVSASGADLSLFAGLIMHTLRDLLLITTNPSLGLPELSDVTKEHQALLREASTLFTPLQVVTMLEHFQTAHITSKTAVIPELPLEIAIVKILSSTPDTPSSPPSAPNAPSFPSHEKKADTKTPTEIKQESKKEEPKQAPEQTIQESTSVSEEASSAVFDLSHIKEHWHSILDTAKKLNASLTLGLSTARPVEITGSTIVIAVKYPFHKERLEEKANQLTLQKAFDTILGAQTKLVIKIDDTATKNSSSAEEDPLISQALNMLGGRIVEGA
jgi:DNA polymerase-3 subunit gamma/tau